jgi:acyl-CoA synthetase (AMP-forming)/AMP-acid ligase II
MCAFLSSLAAGSSICLPRGGKFSVSVFWHDFISTRCNWYTAVPTMHTILLGAAKTGKGLEAGPFREGYKGPGVLQFSSNYIPMHLLSGSAPNIRFIRSCSSALAPSTLYELEKAFRAPVLEAYAMTEAAHQMTSNVAGKRYPGEYHYLCNPWKITLYASLDRDGRYSCWNSNFYSLT